MSCMRKTELVAKQRAFNATETLYRCLTQVTSRIGTNTGTSTEMAGVREQLLSIEEKYKRFKQQQFIFITALERSREHARDKTEPVSTVEQVQRYMNHHCSNSTDRRIFLLFLEIISDLGGVLKHLESSLSSQNTSCEGLDTCRDLLGPNSNISQLRAHYPHSEINRLSCNEARNFYGGIVSVIPLALDLLTTYSRGGAQRLTPTATETSQQTVAKNVGMVGDLDKDASKNLSRYKKVQEAGMLGNQPGSHQEIQGDR